jgi:hypothetical protein
MLDHNWQKTVQQPPGQPNRYRCPVSIDQVHPYTIFHKICKHRELFDDEYGGVVSHEDDHCMEGKGICKEERMRG